MFYVKLLYEGEEFGFELYRALKEIQEYFEWNEIVSEKPIEKYLNWFFYKAIIFYGHQVIDPLISLNKNLNKIWELKKKRKSWWSELLVDKSFGSYFSSEKEYLHIFNPKHRNTASHGMDVFWGVIKDYPLKSLMHNSLISQYRDNRFNRIISGGFWMALVALPTLIYAGASFSEVTHHYVDETSVDFKEAKNLFDLNLSPETRRLLETQMKWVISDGDFDASIPRYWNFSLSDESGFTQWNPPSQVNSHSVLTIKNAELTDIRDELKTVTSLRAIDQKISFPVPFDYQLLKINKLVMISEFGNKPISSDFYTVRTNLQKNTYQIFLKPDLMETNEKSSEVYSDLPKVTYSLSYQVQQREVQKEELPEWMIDESSWDEMIFELRVEGFEDFAAMLEKHREFNPQMSVYDLASYIRKVSDL